jgi:peroxiredoxin (alkyl hydroperoxide reductase subunit C)
MDGENATERVNQPLRLNDPAPDFQARTTQGVRSLQDYRGHWLIFFSHPADFTPVCTSEFIALAGAADRFAALDCELLGLSVDSLYAHLAWVRDIRDTFSVTIPFPIVEDPSLAIALGYGMIGPRATDSSTVRATYFIDPNGIVRAMNWYPMTVGRSVDEMLRLLAALQAADAAHAAAPQGWKPGDHLLAPAPLLAADVLAPKTDGQASWYYRKTQA